MRGHKFQFQNLGTEYRNFQDCFRTVLTEFSRLISDSPDLIFGTVLGHSRHNFGTVCG